MKVVESNIKAELKFLRTIAKDEGVAETTLRRYYKKYGNIDKAVYMAKIQRSKKSKSYNQNTELTCQIYQLF